MLLWPRDSRVTRARCTVVKGHATTLAPQFRPFPPNVLPQTPQNMAVDLAVDGLAHGNNPANVEQNDEHALGRAADLSRLLRLWSCWTLPLRPLLFGLWVVLRLWSCGLFHCDHCCLVSGSFFGCGAVGLFHCEDCCLVSGSFFGCGAVGSSTATTVVWSLGRSSVVELWALPLRPLLFGLWVVLRLWSCGLFHCDHCCLVSGSFFGCGAVGLFHCDHCCLVSGSFFGCGAVGSSTATTVVWSLGRSSVVEPLGSSTAKTVVWSLGRSCRPKSHPQ